MPTLQTSLTSIGNKLRRTLARLHKSKTALNTRWTALSRSPTQSRFKSYCAAATRVAGLECEAAYLKLQLDRTARAAESALQAAKKRQAKRKPTQRTPTPKRKKVPRKKAKRRAVKKTRKR